ncbi:MAG: hypothetical protein HY397_03610 [Candidatus Doudnabacteria bacterium]|nr:hypothetical protein [Candidatus Doudnabacteria bacterium]
MRIRPLRDDLVEYLQERNLIKQWENKKYLFEQNPKLSGLNTELLEPGHLKLYSFRLTQKYRVIFIYAGNQEIEVVDINDHYQ